MAERIPASQKIDDSNRTISLLFTKDDPENPIEIVWDRLDQALYLKENKTTHRIYPSLVPGAPTVAAQISNLKEGYKPTELPKGNEIKISIYDLDTLYVEFTNKVYLKSFGGSLLSDLLSDSVSTGTSTDLSNDFTTIDGARGVSNVYLSAIPQGNIRSGSLTSQGSGYLSTTLQLNSTNGTGAQLSITTDDGGSVISTELVSGGQGFSKGEIIDLEGGTGAQFTVDEVMLVGPEVGYDVGVMRAFAEEVKADSVYFALDTTLDYSTTYLVTLEDVYNLAYESTTHEELITTIDAPAPCAPITSITFEAYGSGEQTLYPKTEQEWDESHSDTDFIYYYGGLTWEEFSVRFGDLLTVPDSVTAPDTVYVYYKDGSFLLEDASWIVGIIGSETGYEPTRSASKTITSGFEWVLYSIDIIGDGYQLTPSGSSTYECGVSEWGGNWGDSIQQFKINRTLVSEN